MKFKERSVLPGFGLSLGYTVLYLSLIVLLPLSLLFFKTASMGWEHFWHAVSSQRALASYRVTFGASLIASLFNAVFGLLVAWVLVRYSFPGRALIDAIVDLPFALPTAVGGIALATAYSQNGWIGRYFYRWGIPTAYSVQGIVIALTFIGLPFVVRTVQPVLQELDGEIEEAAVTLGANRAQIFQRVIFPSVLPAVLTGFALAFARSIGEYGSVVFIAGNMPGKTEIAPLLIVTELEQFDYAAATGIAVVLLIVSFVLLLLINSLQWWTARRLAMA